MDSFVKTIIATCIGFTAGVLMAELLKALYRRLRKITIDWVSVGIYVGITIVVVIIFAVTIFTTLGIAAVLER